MLRHFAILAITVAWLTAGAMPVLGCMPTEVPSPKKLVERADLIVRATALEALTITPRRGEKIVDGPVEVIRFQIDEVIKGKFEQAAIMLDGWAVANDDFNEEKVPYSRVRSDGLKGACSAHEFRLGQMYLLVLQRRDLADERQYSQDWYALAPTAEQLRSPADPWLRWVRKRVPRASRPD